MQSQFINKLLKPEAKQRKSDIQVSPRNLPCLIYSVPSHRCTAGEMLSHKGKYSSCQSPKKPKTQAEKKNISKSNLKDLIKATHSSSEIGGCSSRESHVRGRMSKCRILRDRLEVKTVRDHGGTHPLGSSWLSGCRLHGRSH